MSKMDDEGLRRLLRSLDTEEKLEAKIDELNKAIGRDPLDMENYQVLANVQAWNSRLEDAVKTWETAKSRIPQDYRSYHALSTLYWSAFDPPEPEKSIAFLEEGIAQCGDPRLKSILMMAKNTLGLHDEAIPLAEEILNTQDERIQAFDRSYAIDILIESYGDDAKKNASRLIELHEKRLAREPENEKFVFEAVCALQECLPPLNAAAKIEEKIAYAKDKCPDAVPPSLDVLGRTYMEAKKYAEAIKTFNELISNHGDNYQVLLSLGQSYYYTGDLGKADECLTKSLAESTLPQCFNPAAKVIHQEAALFKSVIDVKRGDYESGRDNAVTALQTGYNSSIARAVYDIAEALHNDPTKCPQLRINVVSNAFKGFELVAAKDLDSVPAVLDMLLDMNLRSSVF